MAEKSKAVLSEKEQPAVLFTKKQILMSERYHKRRDLVTALLDNKKTYTIETVDKMIEDFMKGKVK